MKQAAATLTGAHFDANGHLGRAPPQALTDLVRTKQYTIIPHCVFDLILDHPDLSDRAKLLLLKLYRRAYRYDDEHNWTTRPRRDELAQLFQCSEKSIERAYAELEAANLLTTHRRRSGATADRRTVRSPPRGLPAPPPRHGPCADTPRWTPLGGAGGRPDRSRNSPPRGPLARARPVRRRTAGTNRRNRAGTSSVGTSAWEIIKLPHAKSGLIFAGVRRDRWRRSD